MRTILSTLAAALVVGACAAREAGGLDHPTAPDQPVLRVELTGGLLPPGQALAEVPPFTLYGDGTVITLGPQIQIYPPPALPSLQAARLSEEGIQQVLAEARRAGLFDPLDDYGMLPVADAPHTVLTVTAGGETHTASVYGLGHEGDVAVQLTEEQAEARRRLAELQGRLLDLSGWLGSEVVESERPYRAERVALISVRVGPDALDQDLTVERDWPLQPGLPGGEGGMEEPGCAVLEGDRAGAALRLAGEVHQLTFFRSQGELLHVLFRPLLPDERSCADLEPS